MVRLSQAVPRLLLTSSLLSQSLPGDRIHSCHQGAGPALANDDPAGAETILVRSQAERMVEPRLPASQPCSALQSPELHEVGNGLGVCWDRRFGCCKFLRSISGWQGWRGALPWSLEGQIA